MINRDMQTVCVERMKDIIGVYGEEFNLNEVSEEKVEKTLLKIADVGIKANVIFSSTVKHALYNLENFRPGIRSAVEFQLFNVWHHVFKTLENDQSDRIEPGVLPPIVEKDSEVEEIAGEASAAQEPEPEVEKIAEEDSVAQEPEPEVENIAEEDSVAQEPEPEVEEIAEEVSAAQKPEPEVEEIAEEVSAAQEPEPEVEEIAEEVSAAQEPEPEVEEIAEEASAVQEPEPEAEVSLKGHKRDWFDLILDISAGFMQFLMRILFKKRS